MSRTTLFLAMLFAPMAWPQADAHQIKHTFRPSEGAHVFKVWRLYLSEFAPLLFR